MKAPGHRGKRFIPDDTTMPNLEGRRQGDDIVQLGLRAGRPIRWTFSEIQADSFRWQGHALADDGATWRLEIDIAFRRTQPSR